MGEQHHRLDENKSRKATEHHRTELKGEGYFIVQRTLRVRVAEYKYSVISQ